MRTIVNDLEIIELEQSIFESSIYNEYLNMKGCYSLQEAEDATGDKIRQVQKDLRYKFDKKIGFTTKMKLMLALQNDKILSKYKEKALACKPTGLTMQKKVFIDTKGLNAVDDKYFAILDKLIKDCEKLDKSKMAEFKKEHPISEIRKKYNEEYQTALVKAVKTVNNYKITAQDIKSAVKYLEDFKSVNDKLSKEYNEEFKKFSDTQNYISYVGELKALKASLYFHKIQLDFEMAQKANRDARQVVVLAAKHNPRNIKESAIENQHIVESELFEMDVELDEFNFI